MVPIILLVFGLIGGLPLPALPVDGITGVLNTISNTIGLVDQPTSLGNAIPYNYTIVDERTILIPYYADPFSTSLAGMPRLRDLPINYPNQGTRWNIVWLPYPARAGDGSRTFILVSRGTENKLLIYLEGGGACTDYYTCWAPVFGVRTAVTLTPNPSVYPSGGILDRSNSLNPFRNWTIVYIPYVTGDVHSGDRVMRYCGVGTNGLDCKVTYHVGFVNAIIAMRWIASQGLWRQVVLSGSSAGGYGTILNSYYAMRIFNTPSLIVIDDSGPGLASTRDPHFTLKSADESWGYLQLAPQGARKIIEETGIPLFALKYGFDTIGRRAVFALYETQEDFVIGEFFLKYTPEEFRQILLDVTWRLRIMYPNNFYRYLPRGFNHTILTSDSFYTFSIYGLPVYKWVQLILEGRPIDVVEGGSLVSAVGNTVGIPLSTSAPGSQASMITPQSSRGLLGGVDWGGMGSLARTVGTMFRVLLR